MSTSGIDPSISPFRWYGGVVVLVLLIALGIGVFLSWDAGDAGYLMTWFWIGVAISILYLLVRIAANVETVRAEL